MGADRIERARRGEVKTARRGKNAGPPKNEAWIWMTREMITSEAFRALSGNAIKVLMRLADEHMSHAGLENGMLLVTHKQFAAYGIRLASVAEAIREAEFFGFIDVDRGIAYRGGHEPNLYRLTWIADLNHAPPTNRWKDKGEQDVQLWAHRRKISTLKRRNRPKQGKIKNAVLAS